MCKVKKWLAVLGAVLLVASLFQLLWAGEPIITTDEHPWVGITPPGGGSGTAVNPPRKLVNSFYLVRVAPTGGFYVVKISWPTPQVKTTDGASKQLESKTKLAQ